MSIETYSNPIFASDPSAEFRTSLDFRPEFLGNHFGHLIKEGRTQDEAKGIIAGIADRDLRYLFWERFTKEKLIHFSYSFDGKNVLSPKYEALGDVSERYQQAVVQRESEGKSAEREIAELEGFLKIREKLAENNDDFTFLLISPPPPMSNYSFYFFGKYNANRGEIDMFAWRNNKSLDEQRDEANRIVGFDQFSNEVHGDDFLREPIFISSSNFEQFREVIEDMPQDSEFEEVKDLDFSTYSKGISVHASMLSELIVSGASEETLRAAQLKIEMDFTKWVTHGEVNRVDIDRRYFTFEMHGRFAQEIRADFAIFSKIYQTDRCANGSCGVSVMSLFNGDSSIYTPGMVLNSMPELFVNYIDCPNCGESIRSGSKECKECGITKSEFDSKSKAN